MRQRSTLAKSFVIVATASAGCARPTTGQQGTGSTIPFEASPDATASWHQPTTWNRDERVSVLRRDDGTCTLRKVDNPPSLHWVECPASETEKTVRTIPAYELQSNGTCAFAPPGGTCSLETGDCLGDYRVPVACEHNKVAHTLTVPSFTRTDRAGDGGTRCTRFPDATFTVPGEFRAPAGLACLSRTEANALDPSIVRTPDGKCRRHAQAHHGSVPGRTYNPPPPELVDCPDAGWSK